MDEEDFNPTEELEEVEVIYADIDDLDDDDDAVGATTNPNDLLGYFDDQPPADAPDTSTLTFTRHHMPVFCSDISKDGTLAITGGQDDHAFIWRTATGDVLTECTGHKDSVTMVGFSFADQYAFTADMKGLVQVWDVRGGKLEWCQEGDELEWCEWHHLSNVLVTGSALGDIYIWKIPEGNCKVIASCGFSCTCGRILADGTQLLAGYRNGQVRLWDIKTKSAIWTTASTSGEITSLDVVADSSLFMLAPSAELYKVAGGKRVAALVGGERDEVETVAFNGELGLVATGTLQGNLYVWDYERSALRHEARLPSGITIIRWASKGRLVVGLTEGAIYVCDGLAGTLKEIFEGHYKDILSLTVFKDSSRVLATSDDGTAKLFTFKEEESA